MANGNVPTDHTEIDASQLASVSRITNLLVIN